jgi:hypothetical protein
MKRFTNPVASGAADCVRWRRPVQGKSVMAFISPVVNWNAARGEMAERLKAAVC